MALVLDSGDVIKLAGYNPSKKEVSDVSDFIREICISRS